MSNDVFFKDRAEEMADLVDKVENGDIRALYVYARLSELNKICASCIKQIKDIALEEAYTVGEKQFNEDGYFFEVRNGATRYSYKNIPDWIKKNKEIKEIEIFAKTAFKSRQKGILTATADGEEIVMPEITVSGDSLIIKTNE